MLHWLYVSMIIPTFTDALLSLWEFSPFKTDVKSDDNSHLHWCSSFLLGVFMFQNWHYSYTERSDDNSYLHWCSSFLLWIFMFQNWHYSYTDRSDDNSYLHWRSSFLFLPVPFSSSPAPCMPPLPAVAWPRTSQCRQNSGSTIAAQPTKQWFSNCCTANKTVVQQLLHSQQNSQQN